VINSLLSALNKVEEAFITADLESITPHICRKLWDPRCALDDGEKPASPSR